MTLKNEEVANEIEILVPLESQVIGDEGVYWIINGNSQPQEIQGGSSIDLNEAFQLVLEAFHYVLLLSSVLMHGRELLKKGHEEKQMDVVQIKIQELIDSLNKRFPNLEDEQKNKVVSRLQKRIEYESTGRLK